MTRLDVRIFEAINGTSPFDDYLAKLKDTQGRAAILARIRRIQAQGHFGDSRSLGAGVHELRIFQGPGYRVYYGRDGDDIVVILRAGNKANQQNDIAAARSHWKDYRQRSAGARHG